MHKGSKEWPGDTIPSGSLCGFSLQAYEIKEKAKLIPRLIPQSSFLLPFCSHIFFYHLKHFLLRLHQDSTRMSSYAQLQEAGHSFKACFLSECLRLERICPVRTGLSAKLNMWCVLMVRFQECQKGCHIQKNLFSTHA